VGNDAFKYMQDWFELHHQLDIVVLHAPEEEEAGVAFAERLHKIWADIGPRYFKHPVCGNSGQKKDEDDEGIDVTDGDPLTLQDCFPVRRTDCENCTRIIPKPKIAVLDVRSLLGEEFLEEAYKQVLFERTLLIPLLTRKFLEQPEFLIRAYYLKLAVRHSDEHVLPVIPDPVNLPNFLFDHLSPIRLFKTDKWGRDKPGMYNYVRERIKYRLVSVLSRKIKDRGRECNHKISGSNRGA
jgi:hypothetical protein